MRNLGIFQTKKKKKIAVRGGASRVPMDEYMCTMCVICILQGKKRALDSSGTETTDGYDPPYRCQELLNLDPLESNKDA